MNYGMREKPVIEILGESIVRFRHPKNKKSIGFEYSESPSDSGYRVRVIFISDGVV